MATTNARKPVRWLWILLGILVILALVGLSIFRQVSRIDRPVTYTSDADHFRYGSISSDVNGIPYWIWATMPEVCKGLLPGGYASLGVIQEPGKPTPIGFSMRRVGPLDQVGPNCALCHSTTVRASPEATPAVYLGAPAQQLDLMGYFRFLFNCGRSASFTKEKVIAAIGRHIQLGVKDRLIYGIAVPQVRKALIEGGAQFDSIVVGRPPWGPGRVDTFNPYKVLVFHQDMTQDKTIGTADFMSIWDQKSREGLWLHWDGNNDSLDERNLSASIGAGATPITLSNNVNMAAINRIKAWLMQMPAPRYPFAIDPAKMAAGAPIYKALCASCHEAGQKGFGAVIPTKYLQTDPERQLAFDDSMAAKMNTIGAGKSWAFHRFRPTQGYASHPLDGIWLRAPYLHNGSVPTLSELLSPPGERRAVFYRGYDVYDPLRVGFVSDVPAAHGRQFYRFDTRDRGNSNGGHLYGIDLTPEQKTALIEYLKTL
ncbi:c-type cytochrome [Sphingomonas azotifigens]|uniref:c-type cytochrome n=1 Tax=Sphingomonas azotifigens TaxID=330920 RepID=UPI000A06AAB3|nr:cytochrome c [Sphingomonas azotifigens]